MAFNVKNPDPAWRVCVQKRQAVLWLGPSWRSFAAGAAAPDLLGSLVRFPWAAVYVDATEPAATILDSLADLPEGIKLRVFADDAGPDSLPPNRLPIYVLRGVKGDVLSGEAQNPLGMLNRLTMLMRMPPERTVFAIGFGTADDASGLVEALRVNRAFRHVIAVGAAAEAVARLEGLADRLESWATDESTLREYLVESRGRQNRAATEILVRSGSAQAAFDLSHAIDASNPISDRFAWISATEVVQERRCDEAMLRGYLANPTESWAPYAAGIPFNRSQSYEVAIRKSLDALLKEGASASLTTWLPAEDGSGATTALRQLCFAMSREGFPVLIARPDAQGFDFRQLSTFLRAAAAHKEEDSTALSDLPWLIAFDTPHVLLHADFVLSLANRLKALMRPVIVLAVRPQSTPNASDAYRALGTNQVLRPVLRNTVDSQEAIAVGKHFSRLLPGIPHRSDADWYRFLSDSVRTGYDGTRSLFWLALRFWLLPFEGKESSIHEWIALKFSAVIGMRKEAAIGLLEVAAMAKYRLVTPNALLEPATEAAMRAVVQDGANVFGIRAVPHGQNGALTIAHVMIAEELLRVASQRADALEVVGLGQCFGLLDLELHLLGRLLKRKSAGSPDCIEVVENLVVTGLRVDKREAPRNFEVRDRIVEMLEQAPDPLWDQSPIFDHHLARARRVLATNPPSAAWDFAARREQLELAENHLREAFEHLNTVSPERLESPLALEVTRALTFVARANLEKEAGDPALAREYEERAEKCYLSAQRLDADNTHLLENYARFKVRRARSLDAGEERTRLVVEAIGLLEIELEVDESGVRDEPITLELATAYELLSEGEGERFLEGLIASNADVALTAMARLELRKASSDEALQYSAAEELLRRIPPATATWGSRVLLYRVVSHRRPYAFAERLDILDQLAANDGFPWPLQMRLEHAILMIQLGKRHEGKAVFRAIREDLPTRSASIAVPPELKFLADPATGFKEPLQTSIVVTNTSSMGRNYYGIPDGWGNEDVPFRPWVFGRERIRVRDDLDCLIQFTNFGPQAVPATTE